MNYNVIQSSLPALLTVNGFSIVYFSPDKLPGFRSPGDEIWEALPPVVQDAIVARFQDIYSRYDSKNICPIGMTGKEFDAWIRDLPELEFTVPDEEVPAQAKMLSTTRLNPYYDPTPRPIVLPDPVEFFATAGLISSPV